MSKRLGTSITIAQLFLEAQDIGFQNREQLFNYINFSLLEKSSNVPVTLNLMSPFDFTKKNNFIYLQYCYVRVFNTLKQNLVFYKLDDITMPDSGTLPQLLHEVVAAIQYFPSLVKIAKEQKNPSKIALYLVKIAKKIHAFYEQYSIKHEPNLQLKNIYHLFFRVVKNFFLDCFQILSLRSMDQMFAKNN